MNNNGPPSHSFDPAGYFVTRGGRFNNGGGDKCVSAVCARVAASWTGE